MDIGYRIKQLRTKNNLTLEELGQPLRINQGFPVAAGTESDLAFNRDAAGYRRSAGDDAGEVFPGRNRGKAGLYRRRLLRR